MAVHNVTNKAQFDAVQLQAGDVMFMSGGVKLYDPTGDRLVAAFNPTLHPTNPPTALNPAYIVADGVVEFEAIPLTTGTLTAVGAQSFTDSAAAFPAYEGDFGTGITAMYIVLHDGPAAGQFFHIWEQASTTTATIGGPQSGPQNWTAGGGATPAIGNSYSIVAGGPIIGCSGVEHVYWTAYDPEAGDRWLLRVTDADTNAPINFTRGDTGLWIMYDALGCDMMYHDTVGAPSNITDNYNGGRVEQVETCRVANFWIRDFTDRILPGHNACGLMTYSAVDLIVEHFELSGSGANIYVKGATLAEQERIKIRYGTVSYATSVNILLGDTLGAGAGNELHHVVSHHVVNGGGAEANLEVTIDADNWDIHHVTLANGENGFRYANNSQVNLTFRDSIVANIGGAQFYNSAIDADLLAAIPGTHTFHHNLYWNNVRTARFNGGNQAALADWQLASGQDANSTSSDPGFINAAAGNYKRAVYTDTGSSTSGVRGAYETGNEINTVDLTQGYITIESGGGGGGAFMPAGYFD